MGILISLGIILWIIYKIDFSLLKKSFEQLNPYWIILMIIIYLSGFIVRGLRWQLILSPIKHLRTMATIEGVIVGYMANNILPARTGELVRAIFIGKKESISKVSAFGTIFIERIFDGLVLVAILIASSLFCELDKTAYQEVNSIIMISCLIFGVAVTLFILGFRNRRLVEKITKVLTKHFPKKLTEKVLLLINKFLDSISYLDSRKNVCFFLTLSVFVWLIEGLVFWIGFLAFNLSANFVIAYFTLAFVNLGMLMPSGPGGVGIFQGFSMLAFSFFGLSKEIALCYSFVVHLIMILPITLIGMFIMNYYGFSISRSTREEKFSE